MAIQNKDTSKNFGENVKYYRVLANLTQQQLANKIERTEETISNIERGVSIAKIDILPDLAQALNISIDKLFQQENNDQIEKENVVLLRKILQLIKTKDISFLEVIFENLKNLEKIYKK